MTDRPPIILLHGWGAHAGVWRTVTTEHTLATTHVTPDFPGYQGTELPLPYTSARLVEQLARRFPNPCLLCGWSMGGQLALTWARAHPEQVRGLILVSTTPSFIRRADWPHGLDVRVLDDFARSLGQDREATLRRFFALQALDGEHAREVATRLRELSQDQHTTPDTVLSAGLTLLRDTDLRAVVGEIRCPTLIVHGGHDHLCPVDAGIWLARTITGARLAIHDDAAHAPFLSHPEWFISRVNDFIDEHLG
jgi:pimeloyl-[acyl-carrier protein] methyl ester esterase